MKKWGFIFFIFSGLAVHAATSCRFLVRGNFRETSRETLSEYQIIKKIEQVKPYLDNRNKEWSEKQKCLCCHTTLPYVMTRAYDTQSAPIFESFKARAEYRVNNLNSKPWYQEDSVGRDSRPTEAVLNAVTLVMYDQARQQGYRAVTLRSIDRIFEQIDETGRLHWLDFELEPFESKNAELWGNTLAILAVEMALANSSYRAPEAAYRNLKQKLLRNSQNLNLNEKSMLLWANSLRRNVLSPQQVKEFANQIRTRQKNDGTWSQKTFLGYGMDQSDTYSTSMALIALVKAGVLGAPVDKAAQKLMDSQKNDFIFNSTQAFSFWPAQSLNSDNTLNQLFATDAATAYAQLALKIYLKEARLR